MKKVDEAQQEWLWLLRMFNKEEKWLSRLDREARALGSLPGNAGLDDWELAGFVLDVWMPEHSRLYQLAFEHAKKVYVAFAKDKTLQPKWYKSAKDGELSVERALGTRKLGPEDFELLDDDKLAPLWMEAVLENASSDALWNGQGEEWDLRDLRMVEGYVESALHDHFHNRPMVVSVALDHMNNFVKFRSYQAAWYCCMQALAERGLGVK